VRCLIFGQLPVLHQRASEILGRLGAVLIGKRLLELAALVGGENSPADEAFSKLFEARLHSVAAFR
jgi:hypothetical protein